MKDQITYNGKKYQRVKKADVEGMTRSWMMGLHAKLKKMGIKA